MQLIKERSFQGLLGSGIITIEGWHCFERDNTGGRRRRRGRRSPQSLLKMADDLPKPVCELLTTSVQEEESIF